MPGREAEFSSDQQSVEKWFNTAAFTTGFSPSPQAFGNSGVGIMRGPGFASVDFTLAKNISVTESNYFQFRTEFFNLFNWANFANPNNNIAVPSTFGRITATSAGPRVIQFAFKLNF